MSSVKGWRVKGTIHKLTHVILYNWLMIMNEQRSNLQYMGYTFEQNL